MNRQKPKFKPPENLPPELAAPYTAEEKRAAVAYADLCFIRYHQSARPSVEDMRLAHARAVEANAEIEAARLSGLILVTKRGVRKYIKQREILMSDYFNALLEQGRLDDAWNLTEKGFTTKKLKKEFQRRIESRIEATARDDSDFCDCTGYQIVTGKPAPSEMIRQAVYSIPHGGWVNDVLCAVCGHRNITPNLPPLVHAFRAAAAGRQHDDEIAVAAHNRLQGSHNG